MTLIVKFITALMIGYAISRTEKPIHKLEKGIAGLEGVSDWYLIMRYIIGTGALYVALLVMLYDDENLKCVLADTDSPMPARLQRLLYIIGMAGLSGAVGIGSGVGLGFLQNSWDDLEGQR